MRNTSFMNRFSCFTSIALLSFASLGATPNAFASLRATGAERVDELSTTAREAPSWISADGLQLTIQSTRNSGSFTLWDTLQSERTTTDQAFSIPSVSDFAAINAVPRNAGQMVLSPNHLEAYYSQEAVPSPPVALGGTTDQIYRSVRNNINDSWPAGSLQADLQSLKESIRPMWMSPDGLRLYLSAADKVPTGTFPSPWDLYVSSRATTADIFSASSTVPLAGLNTDYTEIEITLSADELTAIFTSTRPGGAGSADLWYASRDNLSSQFSQPTNLVDLNTSGADRYPTLWQNSLYFMSDRNGNEDIYLAQLIPEPASLATCLIGMAGFFLRRTASYRNG